MRIPTHAHALPTLQSKKDAINEVGFWVENGEARGTKIAVNFPLGALHFLLPRSLLANQNAVKGGIPETLIGA
ncbi:hypothetical protein TorRG33x02_316300 [Trema orientale]|uniref:Uncharacterized protein n=1 Tax=Trema orientale TaxID=63057 RepID=A0A2P5BM09_TREOI|nr:hypothetical protein TorRG33x02_316300 [Trema orientale]